MRRLFVIAFSSCLLLLGTSAPVAAGKTTVDCSKSADLQKAIDRATSEDKLIIKGRCWGNFSIIGKDLTLKGGGPRAALIGGGTGSVLRLQSPRGGRVRLVGLTIKGSGDGQDDIGIRSQVSTLILRDSMVKKNRGGGIGAEWGKVILRDSAVKKNARSGLQETDAFFFLEDSTVEDNGGAGIVGDADLLRSAVRDNDGRGIWADDQGGAVLRQSIVEGNGGTGLRATNVRLLDSIVRRNGNGGVSNHARGGTTGLTIERSVVRGNVSAGDGGGIVCFGRCSVIDSDVRGNTAAGDGGGIHMVVNPADPSATFTVRRTIVVGNNAGGDGGGILNATGEAVVIKGVLFKDNRPNDCVGC